MKKLIISIIILYQKTFSLWLNKLGVRCKFYPTCSQYMILAINKYGVKKGVIVGFKRLLRCNHFSKGGYDNIE